MKLWLVMTVGFASALIAETAPTNPNITVNVQPSPSPTLYRGQPIFSDNVFGDVGKEVNGPTTTKSPYSGSVRGMGAEADYNSDQRDEWLAKCESFKGQDAKAFRDCFQIERKKNLDQLKSQRETVERRQSLPYRNAQSVPELGQTGEPAFGGVDNQE